MRIATLCLVHTNSQILLGLKKRGFGAGRWNGFGGKVAAGESIADAAARELTEECGIVGRDFVQKAILRFRFETGEEPIEAHLFEVTEFDGEPVETEEMRPQWYYKNEIPFDKMWPDDHLWFPYFLDGKNFEGEFLFKDHNVLLDSKIKEISN